jgi:hypothetical protein
MGSYTYAGTGYANPHAVTQIATGLSTSTFQFDNNGNVIQKLTDGVLTTYQWDYANRLIALGVNNASTTYGYDAFGARVLQIGTSTTTIYPVKWYSVASSTGTGAKYSTTTEFMFNGDTLLSTIDQQLASGSATGSAQRRYVHPDHLGSTNVVTNESGLWYKHWIITPTDRQEYQFPPQQIKSENMSACSAMIPISFTQTPATWIPAEDNF